MSDSLNSGVTDVPSPNAADAAPSHTSTTSVSSSRPSAGRHRAEENPAGNERIAALVARKRRLGLASETHRDAREPVLARLDRWADLAHQWLTETAQKVIQRRLRPAVVELAEPIEEPITNLTRPRPTTHRPARSRFDGPLPRRRSMEALKAAISQTVEQVGVTRDGEPIWYRISATNMIPVLNIPTRK